MTAFTPVTRLYYMALEMTLEMRDCPNGPVTLEMTLEMRDCPNGPDLVT